MLTDNEIKSQWLVNNIPFTSTDRAERQELEDEKRAKEIRNAQTQALYEQKTQWLVMHRVIKSLGGSLRESKEQCAAQEIAAERMEKKNRALEDEQLSLTAAVTKYKEEKHHMRLQIEGLEKDIMLAKLGNVKEMEKERKATVDLQSARETITALNNKREADERQSVI